MKTKILAKAVETIVKAGDPHKIKKELERRERLKNGKKKEKN